MSFNTLPDHQLGHHNCQDVKSKFPTFTRLPHPCLSRSSFPRIDFSAFGIFSMEYDLAHRKGLWFGVESEADMQYSVLLV
jgi:hypothetical protein